MSAATGESMAGEQAQSAARQASGSSFYAGMRILPRPQREAMYAVYSFCRAVDDIADEGGTRPERQEGLERWRAEIEALYAGAPTPATAALAEPVRAFGLEQQEFLAIIDGMAMDAGEDIRAPDEVTLDLYCDRVASAVGRLSVRIFGISSAKGADLAHHLGRALQKTNILRDLDEDAEMGRLYLPREALRAAGISATEPSLVLAHPALGRACAPLVTQARAHFEAAEAIMAGEPRKTTRAPRLMAAVYRQVLDEIALQGFAAPRSRVRIPKHKLLFAVLRHGLF